jgi:hypothetical protein
MIEVRIGGLTVQLHEWPTPDPTKCDPLWDRIGILTRGSISPEDRDSPDGRADNLTLFHPVGPEWYLLGQNAWSMPSRLRRDLEDGIVSAERSWKRWADPRGWFWATEAKTTFNERHLRTKRRN